MSAEVILRLTAPVQYRTYLFYCDGLKGRHH